MLKRIILPALDHDLNKLFSQKTQKTTTHQIRHARHEPHNDANIVLYLTVPKVRVNKISHELKSVLTELIHHSTNSPACITKRNREIIQQGHLSLLLNYIH